MVRNVADYVADALKEPLSNVYSKEDIETIAKMVVEKLEQENFKIIDVRMDNPWGNSWSWGD